MDGSSIERRYYISPELEKASCYRAVLEIVDEITDINQAFRELLKDKDVNVFEIDARAIPNLATPCNSWEDFEYKLGRVRVLLEMDVDALRRLVPNYSPEWKGLKLIGELFRSHGLLTETLNLHCQYLRNVIFLCSKTHHRGLIPSQRYNLMSKLELCRPFNPDGWRMNWDKLTNGLLESFHTIRCALESLTHPGKDCTLPERSEEEDFEL